ncbi:AbrB/MazE/SpoVT family DNA-binding domain-containing protein [Rhodopila sp.]|uniref:AbrB/MazE/SpoVT family DNA-binding domain-containing protein n=1 Tax=Rhodopila sp. TaxID=2480087 RepID=UPI003D12A262
MSTITVKGQVTVPKPIREFLDVRPGNSVEFVLDPAGEVILRKVGAEKPAMPRFERVVGSAGPGMSTDEIMALLRGDD